MPALALILAVLLALTAFVSGNAQQRLLHQERSLYRNVYVTQDGDERCMLFRYPRPYGRQTCKLLSQPDKLVFDYTQMMLAGLYLNPNPQRILVIGEGGGTIPTVLQDIVPNAQIDVVEIDRAVDSVARTYFDFKPGPKVRVTIEDGRVFIKRMIPQRPNYDMVFLDAFADDYIPEHLLTREFMQEVKSILSPNGIIVGNTFSESGLYDYESVTYRAAFGPFFNLKLANRIVIGRPNGIRPDDLATARRNAPALEAAFAKHGTSSSFLLPLFSTAVDWNPNTRLLTDQYSPSNLLNALPR